MAKIPLYIERIDTFIPADRGEAFFAEIGRIVTFWGAVDSALDLTLQKINRQDRDPTLHTKLTRSQKHRRTALKNWFQNDPQLVHVREDGARIIEAASRIQVYRDVFTHGQFLEFVPIEPPKIKFATLRSGSRKPGRVHTFALSRLRQISGDLETLRFASLALATGAVSDSSMPASELYELARKRFRSNLDQLDTLGPPSRK